MYSLSTCYDLYIGILCLSTAMGYSNKKKGEGEWGVEDLEFPGVLKKLKGDFLGV